MRTKLTWRIWLLLFILLLSFLAIAPWGFLSKGVLIKSVEKNSSFFNEGLRAGMLIHSINLQEIKNIQDYTAIISDILPSSNETKLVISTDKGQFIILANETPEIIVADMPNTKIKLGLDLQGGSRALVRPEAQLTSSELDDLISITSNRLNAFGITDITVRSASDLSGNTFMLVEVAGATPLDLRELIEKQGKFEAKIGNETVFVGGEQDITYVARTGQEAGIETCFEAEGGFICRYRFAVYLSEEAAQRHANITSRLSVNATSQGARYLNKPLDLYIDDNLIDSLQISEELKGKVTTQVSVQGSGSGKTRQDAFNSAKESMKKLQTVLITGSLPYKLEIVKLDTISPTLGRAFTKNILILGIAVFLIISIVLFVRYRKIKITLSVILTMFSEAFITLGIVALLKNLWTLDTPGIAGIIAGMGTGVNDQIIIIDESVSETQENFLERIKRALFIIIGAFLTIVAAMLPLFGAGAGLLKGFALTTIIAVTVGILITRPAFADIIKGLQR